MPNFNGDPRNHGFADAKVKMPDSLPQSIGDLVRWHLAESIKTKCQVYSNEAKRIIDMYRVFYDMKTFEEEWMWTSRVLTNHFQRLTSLEQEPYDGDNKEVYF